MELTTFNDRLKRLACLVGREAGTELFTVGYEELLNEVRSVPDAGTRHSYAARMSKLLMLQLAFVMNEYVRGVK